MPSPESTDQPQRPQPTRAAPTPWPTWALLGLFIFLSFECLLLAFALKGPWLVLAAPGLVCGIKAWDTWKGVRRG